MNLSPAQVDPLQDILRPYECTVCNKRFESRRTLSKHHKTHSDKFFECELCDYRTKWPGNIKTHVKTVHQKLPQYSCEVCGRAFGHRNTLKQHRQTHNREKAFKCEKCDFQSNYKAYFDSHVKVVHEKLPLYKCEVCDKTFSNRGNLSKHRRHLHNHEKTFKCEQCDFKTNYKLHIADHVKVVHEKLQLYKCDVCGKSLSSKSNLRQHRQAHNRKKIKRKKGDFKSKNKWHVDDDIKVVHKKLPMHTCEVCDRTFSKGSILKQHRRTHNREKTFKCEQCDFQSNYKAYFATHVKVVHEKLTLHNCEVCEKTFSSRSNLSKHRRHAHNSKKLYKCEQCDFKTGYKLLIANHVKVVHKKIQLHKCEVCDKTLSRKSNLSQHRQAHSRGQILKSHVDDHVKVVHEKLPLHKCEVCSNTFSNSGNLSKHRRHLHNHEKTFKCEQCDFKTNYKLHIADHVKVVHQKLELYKCDVCDKTLSSKANLNQHRQTHYGKLFQCEQCDFRSNWKSYIAKHVDSVHKGLRPIKCSLCEKTYSSNSLLTSHLRTHTEHKPFQCEHCEFRSKWPRNIESHKKAMHGKRLENGKKTHTVKSGPRAQSTTNEENNERDQQTYQLVNGNAVKQEIEEDEANGVDEQLMDVADIKLDVKLEQEFEDFF